jgi:hypothetical protein
MTLRTFIGLISFFLLAVILQSNSYASDPAGKVLAVKKEVIRIRDNNTENAKPLMELQMKDAVETKANSRTKLFFSDDSILNVSELSRVEVEEYIYSNESDRSKSIYNLIDGSLKVVVGRSDLEVHTSTAVAAARGTKFIMWSRWKDDLDEAIEKALTDADIKSALIINKKKHKRTREECVMTLEGKVELLLKEEFITKNTKKKRLFVNEGEIGCVSAGSLVDVRPTGSADVAKWDSKFPTFYSSIPTGTPPAAFAPAPIKAPDLPVIPQQPAVPVVTSPVTVEIVHPISNGYGN